MPPPPGIFISYRREDASGYAGRLHDHLVGHFGPDRVFIDVDSIQPGIDFVAELERALAGCYAVIALIGPRWLSVTNGDGRRRLDVAEDFVRVEIETALALGRRVIPTLVQGARMPRIEELPSSLSGLSRHQALELDDRRWRADIATLLHLLEQLSAPDASSPVTPPATGPIDEPVPLSARLGPQPGDRFVGRTSEQQVLADALKQVDAERRRLVLISGEPGIGKTALCAEFAQRAHAQGTVVLYGHCDEGLDIPYQPWAEALGHLVARGPEALLDALGEKRLGELSRLLPAVTQRRPQLPALVSTDPEAARYLLYAAAVALLGASNEPLVVILDDLHWADRATLDLLRFLMGSPERIAVLVVATFRHSELDASHALSDVLAALHREPGVQRLTLGGLGDVEVIELMEAVAGHKLDGEGVALAHALWRETDGNPFFTSELLRHLAETGAIYQRPDGRWSARDDLAPEHLPVSVREVLGHRVARLGGEAERILELAAVIGRSFDLDLLGAVADVEADELIRVLETAAAAALVSELSAQQFSFAHALVQHALSARMSPARLARAHRRVAEALEEGQHPAAELARHWMAAIVPTDVSRAVVWAQRAGEQALADLAPAEAVRWYSQALELLTRQAAQEDRLRCELLVGLGDAQRQAGDPTYRRTLLDAAHLAQHLGETDLLVAAALAGHRGFESVIGEVDAERVAVLEAALRGVGTHDSAERARLLALMAVELADADDFHHRKALADEAEAVARRLGDPAVVVNVLISAFFATVAPETLAQRRAAIREAAELARALGDPVNRFWAEAHYIGVSLEAGDREELDRGFRVMEEVAAEVGQPFLRWVATYQASWRALLSSDIVGAERLALQALQVGSESGQPEALVLYGLQLMWVRAYQGRLGELIPLAAQMVADNPANYGARAGLAYAYCEVGQLDEARGLLSAESAAGFVRPVNSGWLPDTTLWAAVAFEVGDAEAAAVLADRLAPWHDQVAYTGASVHGAVAMYCGGLARVLGRDREAETYFAEALVVNEHLRAPFFVAHTNLEWARLLVERRDEGDLDRARAQLIETLNLAREHGFGTVERRAAALLSGVA